MEHSAAISQVMVPLLLGLLCVVCSYGNYMLKRIIQQNEKEHEKFFENGAVHERRITRVETKVDHVEHDLEQIRQHGTIWQ